MIKQIKIGSIAVGENQPVFIIAEAGVNHNGNLNTALKLVDAAAAAGADAVKFQTFKAGEVVTKRGEMAAYQKKNLGKTESQLEMLKKLELPEKFYRPIIKRCKEKNIIFLSTPHGGFASVDFLARLNVPTFKFGSGDLNNLPVLQYAAKFNKPMILATGMATMAETHAAVSAIKKTGNNKIIALHCTSNYPCPLDQVNLLSMTAMKRSLGVLVGYSDHTEGIQTSVLAAALGASLIEKHFTLDRNLPGPDHKASLEPDELKAMVRAVRQVSVIFGSSIKRPDTGEKTLAKIARKSLVASKSIKRGEKFTKNNLEIKRPGTGLAPSAYFKVIGKTSRRDIAADELIKKSDYER